MENARNTFYLALRNQLALVNPSRTMVVRGVQRPGLLVEENESAVAQSAADVFVLRWTKSSLDEQHALPLAEQTCEVRYWTEGTSTNGGLDRGRMLAQMDADLVRMLGEKHIQKQNFSVNPPVPLATQIFWTGADFAPVVTLHNRLTRVATVVIYSYEEAADQ